MDDTLQLGDPSLLRAARVADVLRGCGWLLATSAGTDDTFKLSSEVDRIDVFISHTWATGRASKFLALALHFNLVFAASLASIAVALGGSFRYVAARQGFLPPLLDGVPVTCTSTFLMFYVALLFGHEAQAALGIRGKQVFLDKACIHQTDHDLKRRGILSLGAFLHRSNSLVVCFTELYLQKLWTVYEFASFLLVHGEACPGSVHIIPTSLPVLGVAISLCYYVCFVLLTRLVQAVGADPCAVEVGRILIAFLCQWLCVYITRGWARQRHEARAAFQAFELANTLCTSEEDRALVQTNIISIMRRCSYVGLRASDTEALMAFDTYVRTASARAFVAAVGRLGFPYSFFLPFQLVLFSERMDSWCAAAARGSPGHATPEQCAFNLIAHFVSTFAAVPLVGAFCMRLVACCPSLRGVAQVAHTSFVSVLIVLAIRILDPYDGQLRPWMLGLALASRASSIPFLLYSAALVAVTTCVYRRPRWKVDAAAAPEADDAGPGGEPVDSVIVEESNASVNVEEPNTGVSPTSQLTCATASGLVVHLGVVVI